MFNSQYKSVFAKPTLQKIAEIWCLTAFPVVSGFVIFITVDFMIAAISNIEEIMANQVVYGLVAVSLLACNIGFQFINWTLITSYKSNEEWEKSARRNFESDKLWKTQ
jgi:hypothetical protein